MDPHHQRGFLVSGQRPPEMYLQPPDKDLNLGQLGTPALMNQFYPGSENADPVNDVNNLPVPDRNYHHQPVIVHDKLVIDTDVMLPRAVEGSRSDDVLIQLTHEQNGTVSSSLSPDVLDTQYAESPENSPDDTGMMNYGMFDLGPELDGRSPIVQFSEFNKRNSNFAPPASGEHPIENDLAMENEGDALAADQERQTDYNLDSLPIAPAQFAHGTGQFETDAYFRDGPQVEGGTVDHTFGDDQDVAGHEGQLHGEQTLETSGQTYNSAQHVPNSGTPGLGAQDHYGFCQPQLDGHEGHQAGHGPMGPFSYRHGDYYLQMDEVHQPVEPQQYNRNGDRMVQSRAMEHTFRAHQEDARHADLLYLEQPLEQSAQAYGSAQHLSNSVAAHFNSVQHRPEPAGTTVGEFCQRRLEMQWEAERQHAIERQHGAMRNETPQSIGNHFYQEKSWGQPTIGDRQTGHESMGPLSYGQSDYYPQMDEDHRQAERHYGPVRDGAPQSEQQAAFNGTMRPLSYGQGAYHPVMGEGTLRRFTPHGYAPRQEVLQGMNLRYQGVESGSYQANSGDVEATDNITGGPRNCRLDFQGTNITTRSASLSDHTDDQISSSGESGFYSSPSTPDQTTTDSSTNGLLPPIFTSEEPPIQLLLPNFTVKSKDDEAFQQAQWDILMDYSDEELDRMDNNGFLLIDNNDTIGFDVDRLCETYEYYARGMDNMLPLDILSNNEVEHFSLTGVLMSNNNEGSASSSSLTPEKKKRNRRSGIKMTPEQKRIHKKEANRKYSTISRDKKKSERDITNRIWKYIQNEIQIQQVAITDIENNVAFANELLELTGQSSEFRAVLQQEAQVYMYWKGEISRISDIRRDEDTKVQDALLKKQSAKEKFEKSGEEYKSKEGGKKTTTIGSQKTRALQNHELVKAQYHILVNRHDLRREKFLNGLAELYFRRTVSRYIQRIWTIPVEVHQVLSQEQKLHQLDKLKNFLRANRHLLKAPS